MRRMKRVYRPYWEWEDFQAGMFNIPSATDIDRFAELSALLLSSPDEFRRIATLVVQTWNVASAVNLTNYSANRQSWIGQSACCYQHGSPELATRQGWRMLSNDQRRDANDVADKVIEQYERTHKRLH